MLAVRLISLARQHGLQLPVSIIHDANNMTIHHMLEASFPSDAASQRSQPSKQQQTQILERDGRCPNQQLRVSGISLCAAGCLEQARKLASSGCWHPAYAVDKHRSTALMWASGAGRLQVVKWLLEEVGVSVDNTNKDGRTALMWACRNKQLDVARYLLQEGGADPTLRMKDDSSTFDWAVLGGDVPTMELIAAHPLVDIHQLNKFGCSAVQWAAVAGNVETCRWLLAKGVNFKTINQARHGAISKAAWKGNRDALQWFLNDTEGPHLTEQLLLADLDGRSAAQLARESGYAALSDWLQELTDQEARNSEADAGSCHLDKSLSSETLAKMKARCALR
eukprot:gnl/TRDRNA2_/TRDRNA2_143492_c1_seq1.p1 gnl/TRDRNA2_/TRDRNA2_143492_c1~~gnl/TRDRNA2_/TRDRNA2_143492_c1_seq1.p1  ORF type:complete len:394 (+),score=54.85 gnl/TRDRNA2_/TRDRNA2_143492_c1_seq1:174-1184(+)